MYVELYGRTWVADKGNLVVQIERKYKVCYSILAQDRDEETNRLYSYSLLSV